MSLDAHQQTQYDTDYLQWIETTLVKLRQREYAAVDWENLIAEIEDTGKRERRSLESNLIVVLLHLLKWQHQPEQRSGSWAGSLVEHRRRLRRALQDSPSLKLYLEQILTDSYRAAVRQAKAETELPPEQFPAQCPYKLTEIMDDEFLPS